MEMGAGGRAMFTLFFVVWMLQAWSYPVKDMCSNLDDQHSALKSVCGYAECFPSAHPFMSGVEHVCAKGCFDVLVEAAALIKKRCKNLALDKETYGSYKTGNKMISILQWAADKEGAKLMCSRSPRLAKEANYSTKPSVSRSVNLPEKANYPTKPSASRSVNIPEKANYPTKPSASRSVNLPKKANYSTKQSASRSVKYPPEDFSTSSKDNEPMYPLSAPETQDTCIHDLSLSNNVLLNADKSQLCNACSKRLAVKFKNRPYSLPTLYNYSPVDPKELIDAILKDCPAKY
ncbi:hypothetical protein DSO57_1020593 [Entomophthora muscae]|uniref:Uncharacterized protein n=1 Tax=Entomophthora muscae TaxID=34485 RepID=A0ACC2UCK0_9FUNG|nr:hypothetical protein DSO57_1020593 [Entomophthora muscae]